MITMIAKIKAVAIAEESFISWSHVPAVARAQKPQSESARPQREDENDTTETIR